MTQMKLTKKLKTCLVSFLILSFATVAVASPGKYTSLKKGDSIPWNGWCFDEKAVSELIVKKEIQQQRCELRVQLNIDKLVAEHNLKIGKLQAKLDYEVSTKDATIAALKQQNQTLEKELIIVNKASIIAPASIGAIIGAAIVMVFWSYSE